MEKLTQSIIDFASENDYEIVLKNTHPEDNIEFIVIDSIHAVIYAGTKEDYLLEFK